MNSKRLKIFAVFCLFIAGLCIIRLGYIQLSRHSAWQKQLQKIRRGNTKLLPALRGRILDRNGNALAVDDAKFALCIDYKYARLADERFWKILLLKENDNTDANTIAEKIHNRYNEDFNILNDIINKCAQFTGKSYQQIKEQINRQINEPIWKLRSYLAWKRKYPKQPSFEQALPDADRRLLLASKVDIAEMHQKQEIMRFDNDDEVLAAKLAFIHTDGVEILSAVNRFYPYGELSSHLIGWVRPADTEDSADFITDDLQRYMLGDIIGFSGIEYICEPFLRGQRGKIVYDIDDQIVEQTEPAFGKDVSLTVDVELQKKIADRITDRKLNSNYYDKPCAAVVIDVNTAEILAYVSLPQFDLNTVRYDYGDLLKDKDTPLIDRVINKNYPPGSTAKPIILAAGLAENEITADEVISCPSVAAPRGWPRCWIERTYGYGHDVQWRNTARNALKGSCNIYFSRLAVRIAPDVLQRWLYDFGYGRKALKVIDDDILASYKGTQIREFRQTAGIISSGTLSTDDVVLEQRKPIDSAERRFFGIGQGNFRANPLQVANAFACLARGGEYRTADIILSKSIGYSFNTGLDKKKLTCIYDGMYAVVNEYDGTAGKPFHNSGFSEKGITVYGKTGSTQKPANAWFAGFAKDSFGHTISFSVLLETGQHGSADAAPIARDIVSFCIELGYLKAK